MTDEKKSFVTMDVVALERLIPRHAYVGDLTLTENLHNYIEWLKAEVDHWKGASKEHAEAQAAAVEAFHDATRLRSQIQQARINAENERDEARSALTDDTRLAEWEKRGVVDSAVIAKLREARAEVERLRDMVESLEADFARRQAAHRCATWDDGQGKCECNNLARTVAERQRAAMLAAINNDSYASYDGAEVVSILKAVPLVTEVKDV